MPSGLGAAARITSRRDFQRVFADGRKVVGRNAIVWYWTEDSRRRPRLGLSVSGKVGSAVRRNRLKRLARETFRAHRGELAPGHDQVVYLRPGCRWQARAQAEAELLELWRKAKVLS